MSTNEVLKEIPRINDHRNLTKEGFVLINEYDSPLYRSKEAFLKYGDYIIIATIFGDKGSEYLANQVEIPKMAFLDIVTHLEKLLGKRKENKGLTWNKIVEENGETIMLERGLSTMGVRMGYKLRIMNRRQFFDFCDTMLTKKGFLDFLTNLKEKIEKL